MKKEILATSLMLVFAGLSGAADAPTAEIQNGELRAKIYLPDAKDGFYKGTRFDWSGVIFSLTYKGHEFYGPWFTKTDPNTRDFVYDGNDIVAGPCSATTGPVDEFQPIGFERAKAGETFIKIGVGALRKGNDNKYDNYFMYPVADGGKWTVRKGRDYAEFTQQLVDLSSGYAYIYKKTVRLSRAGAPEMVLEHSLKNTGSNRIETSVYNHNFLIMDGQAPGPGLTMTVPFAIETSRPPNKELAEVSGKQLAYLKPLQGKDVVFFPVEGFSGSAEDHQIKIENSKLKIGMSITGDKRLQKAQLWSIRSVMSIEPFVAVAVEPGSEFTWKTTYRYYELP
jgi:hypothetical protein